MTGLQWWVGAMLLMQLLGLSGKLINGDGDAGETGCVCVILSCVILSGLYLLLRDAGVL